MDSERELEMIKSEMEAKRASLATKISELESTVRDTVTTASESVTATVDTVKDAVSNVVDGVTETVDSVKETFSLQRQVERHPWEAFGAAVVAGLASGYFLSKPRESVPLRVTPPAGAAPVFGAHVAAPPPSDGAAQASRPQEPGMLDHLLVKLKDSLKIDEAVDELKAMAIAQLTDVAKGLVEQVSPNAWNEGLAGVVKDLGAQFQQNLQSHLAGLTQPSQGASGRSFEEGLAPEPDPAWTGPRSRATSGSFR